MLDVIQSGIFCLSVIMTFFLTLPHNNMITITKLLRGSLYLSWSFGLVSQDVVVLMPVPSFPHCTAANIGH